MRVTGDKIAVIVNGDTEQRHLENAQRMLLSLRRDGYEVFLLNPRNLNRVEGGHYFTPTLPNLRALQEMLRSRANAHTDLVIATTGHGALFGDKAEIQLQDDFDHETVTSVLDGIPYDQRVIYMDQCYSGNWSKIFLNDPKTLFISLGSQNETDVCQEFNPLFWGDHIPDLNGDHAISFQERYAYAVHNVNFSIPQFLPSAGYRQKGQPLFAAHVQEVADASSLNEQLHGLQGGQYAIFELSAPWKCEPCDVYKPVFERFAATGGGQHLWLRTKDSNLATEWGVTAYPTVIIVNAHGDRFQIPNEMRNNVEEALSHFSLPFLKRIEIRIIKIERMQGEQDRLEAFKEVTKQLQDSGLKEKTVPYFNQLATMADQFVDPSRRTRALIYIASGLYENGQKEAALHLLDRSIPATKLIRSQTDQSILFGLTASYWYKFGENVPGRRESAFDLFIGAILLAQKIKDTNDNGRADKAFALGTIAFQACYVGLSPMALSTFKDAIAAARQIRNKRMRKVQLSDLEYMISNSRLKDENQLTLTLGRRD